MFPLPSLAAIEVLADVASLASMRETARAARIPTVAPEGITQHTEGLCAVVWHLPVSHPALKRAATKWESTR